MPTVTILGPQRHELLVREALDEQGLTGRVGAITGGWEEREDEQALLEEHIKRPTVQLGLHRRLEQVLDEDKPLQLALRDRNDRLRVAQTLYRRRLGRSLQAVRELHGITVSRMELLPAERADALRAVSYLDDHYLSQIRSIHGAFTDLWNPIDRPAVAAIRAALEEELSDCCAVVIAGGNVGVLLDQMALFHLRPLLEKIPVIAWSAGAMVLTDRIVLFHDSPPQGRGDPEVYDDGLGLAPSLVALPHAGSRLRLDDKVRVGILAERFKPATCVALDEGCGLQWDGRAWSAFGRTRRLEASGKLIGMVSP